MALKLDPEGARIFDELLKTDIPLQRMRAKFEKEQAIYRDKSAARQRVILRHLLKKRHREVVKVALETMESQDATKRKFKKDRNGLYKPISQIDAAGKTTQEAEA